MGEQLSQILRGEQMSQVVWGKLLSEVVWGKFRAGNSLIGFLSELLVFLRKNE